MSLGDSHLSVLRGLVVCHAAGYRRPREGTQASLYRILYFALPQTRYHFGAKIVAMLEASLRTLAWLHNQVSRHKC